MSRIEQDETAGFERPRYTRSYERGFRLQLQDPSILDWYLSAYFNGVTARLDAEWRGGIEWRGDII